LNSLFKVLFNFPSRYLFAIGLVLYLALDGVYHLIWAAITNNPTQEYSHDIATVDHYGPYTLNGNHNHVNLQTTVLGKESTHTLHFPTD
jgi:hypothetical protein